jgi:hypothetical protein
VIEQVLADVTVMRWPAGQRFVYLGALHVAAASPQQGVLLDQSGRPLTSRDLAGILRVDARTVDRFLERALQARRLRTHGGVYLVEISNPDGGAELSSQAVDVPVDAAVEVRRKARPGPDLVMPSCNPDDADAESLRARAACLTDLQRTSSGMQQQRDLWKLPGDLLPKRRERAAAVPLSPELELLLEQLRFPADDPASRRRLLGTVRALQTEGLPFAAFADALDRLKQRRRRGGIRDEPAYYAKTLRGIRDEEYAHAD